MGTSNAYGGPSDGIIPSWVDDASEANSPDDPGIKPDEPDDKDQSSVGKPAIVDLPTRPSLSIPRGNYTRFTNSGSGRSLSRAISGYLASTGGGRRAAQRMPSSTRVASGIASIVNSFVTTGPREALQRFELQNLVGRPAVEVLDALADKLCPDGGTIDEGIARDAMLEAIADFAVEDLGSFEDLTPEQLQEFLADVVTRCIETKVINEIGTNSLHGSKTDSDFQQAEEILHDYTSQAVHDALVDGLSTDQPLTTKEMDARMTVIFGDAFDILESYLKGL